MKPGASNSAYLYCIPLEKKGKKFVEALDKSSFRFEAPLFSEMEDYLHKHYHEEKSIFELYGHHYFLNIFHPNEDDDYCYVVCNSQGIPEDFNDRDMIEIENIDSYLDELAQSLVFSEGFSADQQSYLRTQFIAPTFKEPDSISKYGKKYTWEEIRKETRLVIIGAPGSGKTTCLRKIAFDLASNQSLISTGTAIPVFIQLRKVSENYSLLDCLNQQLSSLRAGYLVQKLDKFFESGRFLLLLDGLDEVFPKIQNQLKKTIIELTNTYPAISIILTSRKAGYQWRLPGFDHLEINPFSENEIMEWTYQKLYESNDRPWNKFISHLRTQPELFPLSRNPLMLSIIVMLYKQSNILPQNDAEIIKYFIDILLNYWDISRGIIRNTDEWASSTSKYNALCRIAFMSTKLEKDIFTKNDFINWESSLLDEKTAKKLLNYLERDTGLIIKNGNPKKDEWSFSHKAFMNYFTAKYLVEQTDDIDKVIKDQINEKSWQDIWRLACSISQDSSKLINLLLNDDKLDDTDKCILVTKVISQNLLFDQDNLHKYCESITTQLESLMVSFINVPSPKISSLGRKILWKIAYQTNTENESRDLINIKKLLRQIYYARSGSGDHFLKNILAGSKNEEVVSFSKCLDYHGRFLIIDKEIENKPTLLIQIVSEKINA